MVAAPLVRPKTAITAYSSRWQPSKGRFGPSASLTSLGTSSPLMCSSEQLFGRSCEDKGYAKGG